MHRQTQLNLEPAFVIHQHAYRETSLLVEVFTYSYGRMGLVARGAKRAKSSFRHILQAFQPLVIRWSGRGDLGTLIHVEPRGVVGILPGKAVMSGLYLNELMMRLTHRHDPQQDLFEAYELSITDLRQGQAAESTLRIFEKRLLQATGYALVLDRDIHTGETINSQQQYIYEPEQGPMLATAKVPTGILISGRTLLALDREETDLDLQCQREAKRLMRYVLKRHLGDRQLHSRSLFRSVENPDHSQP